MKRKEVEKEVEYEVEIRPTEMDRRFAMQAHYDSRNNYMYGDKHPPKNSAKHSIRVGPSKY